VKSVSKAIFPLDKQLGLNKTVYSAQLGQKIVWLSGLLPFAACAAVFDEIGGQMIPASSIWRQTQHHGQRLQACAERERDSVSVERVVLPEMRYDHDQRKGVSLDGGMVNIRGEGWREMKVGAVFDIQQAAEDPARSRQVEQMSCTENVHYTAVLGSSEAFTPALWALAVTQDVPTAKDRVVVGDGALWVWNVAEDVCPDAWQIVDWFHAVQHLVQAANTLYPQEKDAKARTQWLNTYKDHLYMGHVDKIIATLRRRGHTDLATYFERHQRRMQYLEFREEGLPIGSGMVESGVKQFKQRLTGAGMRWNADNAQRMLTLRAAVLGNDFHDLWRRAA
jgi:hypothetical protein